MITYILKLLNPEIAKISPYCWCKCNHGNNNKNNCIGSFICTMQYCTNPQKSLYKYLVVSKRYLTKAYHSSSYILLLYTPLLMKAVHKATSVALPLLSMFEDVIGSTPSVSKSCIALNL